MRRATDIVVASAAQAGGFVGYLDYATASRSGCRRVASAGSPTCARNGPTRPGAPADGVERSLEHLFEHRRNVTAGSFVFSSRTFSTRPRARLG
jgi:hypothetical protein